MDRCAQGVEVLPDEQDHYCNKVKGGGEVGILGGGLVVFTNVNMHVIGEL